MKDTIGKASRKAIVIIAVTVIAVVIAAAVIVSVASKRAKPEIFSVSTLERIINVSELSTFEAVYNGIAEVADAENPEKINYYVSYDAKVIAGINFEDVDISVDHDNKLVTVIMPEIKINEINVAIESLDYIFLNDKENTSTVSTEAYKKCIEDVENESQSNDAILQLAGDNARNIIEALIKPFIQQLDEEYQLQIV